MEREDLDSIGQFLDFLVSTRTVLYAGETLEILVRNPVTGQIRAITMQEAVVDGMMKICYRVRPVCGKEV